jgi:hypothetical protein
VKFQGLKSPDSLKQIGNMFKTNEYKDQPEKYYETLLSHVNYDEPEQVLTIKTDIIYREHGGDHLRMKIFKMMKQQNAETGGDSDNEDPKVNAGGKNLTALIYELRK